MTDQSTPRKQVRFSSPLHAAEVIDDFEEAVQQHQQQQQQTSQLSDRWYLPTEFVLMKKKARMIAKESIRFGYSTGLEGTFGMESDIVQSKLNLWCKHGHSRRGLEEWSNREHHRSARKKAKKDAIRGVLELQEALKEEAGSRSPVDPESLANVSSELSRNARAFARMMGLADAFAAATDGRSELLIRIQDRVRSPLTPMVLPPLPSQLQQPFPRQEVGDTFLHGATPLENIEEMDRSCSGSSACSTETDAAQLSHQNGERGEPRAE